MIDDDFSMGLSPIV